MPGGIGRTQVGDHRFATDRALAEALTGHHPEVERFRETLRERALAVARRLTTGAVFVNAVTASDARLPFGGTRQSGHGRELAAAGMLEFCNVRTFWATPER